MGYVPPAPLDTDAETVSPLTIVLAALAAIVVIAFIVGGVFWFEASRSGVLTYVCQPGDTAVVRDGFGQHTPMCVTTDGSTTYWPDRVRVPRGDR